MTSPSYINRKIQYRVVVGKKNSGENVNRINFFRFRQKRVLWKKKSKQVVLSGRRGDFSPSWAELNAYTMRIFNLYECAAHINFCKLITRALLDSISM